MEVNTMLKFACCLTSLLLQMILLEPTRGTQAHRMNPEAWDLYLDLLAQDTPDGVGSTERSPFELKVIEHAQRVLAERYPTILSLCVKRISRSSLWCDCLGIRSRFDGSTNALDPDTAFGQVRPFVMSIAMQLFVLYAILLNVIGWGRRDVFMG